MHFSIRSSLSRLVCLLAVSLSIVSCGGSGTSTTSSTNSMTLRVGQISNSIQFFPMYVALQENYFKAQGLTLDPPTPIMMGGSGAKLATAVEANSVDIAVGVITDAFTLSRVDAYVRLLGTLTNGYAVDIVVGKRFEQQTGLTEASPLEAKVKALVGKKIGISGLNSGTEGLLTYLFRQYGLNAAKDTTLVIVGGTPAAALAALRSGRIDAFSYFAPAGQEAAAQGIGNMFISPVLGDVPAMNGQLHGVLYTKQNVIDAKPKAVAAFIRAVAQAEAFVHNNPTQATVLLGKYLNSNNQAFVKKVFAVLLPIIPQAPQINRQAYNTANQFHVQAGLIAIALPYKDMVASSTIQSALSGMSSSS
jgi:NitT/TauT family transport system substrate-binding protein